MDSARKIDSDSELHSIVAVGTGFIIDPFNRLWHSSTCPRIQRMTVKEPKWFAPTFAALTAFLDQRLTRYATAKPILPCTDCRGDDEVSSSLDSPPGQ